MIDHNRELNNKVLEKVMGVDKNWGYSTKVWEFQPSSNYNHVRAVLEQIEFLAVQDKFCVALHNILDIRTHSSWTILNATAEQICEAALKAVEP